MRWHVDRTEVLAERQVIPMKKSVIVSSLFLLAGTTIPLAVSAQTRGEANPAPSHVRDHANVDHTRSDSQRSDGDNHHREARAPMDHVVRMPVRAGR